MRYGLLELLNLFLSQPLVQCRNSATARSSLRLVLVFYVGVTIFLTR